MAKVVLQVVVCPASYGPAVSWANALTVGGAALEVGGLSMTLADQLGVQRHWFPEHTPWRKRWGARLNAWWLRRTDFMRRPHPAYPANLHGASAATATASGSLSVVGIANRLVPTIGERVDRLADALAAHEANTERVVAAVRTEITEMDRATRKRFEQEADERRREHDAEREAVGRSLRFQQWGFVLFLFGVGFSAWGGVLGNG